MNLAEMSHAQHDRCAICLTRPCTEAHRVLNHECVEVVQGLLCPACLELVSLFSVGQLREEYGTGQRRMEEDGRYLLSTGNHTHDLFTMRWALEYMEEQEDIGPDDPTLYHFPN